MMMLETVCMMQYIGWMWVSVCVCSGLNCDDLCIRVLRMIIINTVSCLITSSSPPSGSCCGLLKLRRIAAYSQPLEQDNEARYDPSLWLCPSVVIDDSTIATIVSARTGSNERRLMGTV
eukprot:GHVQ01009078.1.p2 GENE.GHVQ01009078.1~~GHVQ01009078.1.p2  ORF type:complete len:119 (-),score=13.60 GHVQ01009078.1:104-460(-)